ncbi:MULTISPECIES: sn-glycerol-3-phosphate ABC transporter ATP-binding protein UgpC [unclassified Ensifer]|uniref:ABC transporter ATP-binding protein n=1 Tax=unclassified Ensifer TaxID=2633371 RepID=UPI0008139BE7|nr:MULTISPECIES: sn-glycerol-3-phosphate ABC transporter ATP-binding protein UgpC [unclassified Ensifer]OCP05686.1 sugar ABC transporter ATP-binding protein [Ensifer sp. LC11]OCP06430.1 sugar ABC transporter ATP-binding protein [Ensifer sp. LC13]OCP06844.1 sugar ABC transporter ATP-binding protein [Ensifer sp. LC14]OCP31331.1 sugar ABC transporter ATP-binding protein [Ensifer sp. LC499]
MSELQLKHVRKSYGTFEVIKGVDLDIKTGEFVVFVGPSGCGKSTLLRMIAGLEEITSGDLTIDGERMNDVDPSKRGIAMVFQSYALYPHMTVRENMGFALRFAGVPKAEIEQRVGEAANILELGPLLDRKPKQLSGGQRQRVAIGRAIVRHPKIFLFDEPLSNLDAELRVHMRIEIARLHKKLATTIIYVTHDQVEAMTLADKIVVMRGGVVEQVGSPLDLYDDPANLFVAGFIGSPKMNFLKGVVETGTDGRQVRLPEFGNATLPIAAKEAAPGSTVTIGIRPEHFGETGSASLDLTIDMLEHLGGETFAYARHGDGEMIIIETKNGRGLKSGDSIAAHFDPAAALVFDAGGQRLR